MAMGNGFSLIAKCLTISILMVFLPNHVTGRYNVMSSSNKEGIASPRYVNVDNKDGTKTLLKFTSTKFGKNPSSFLLVDVGGNSRLQQNRKFSLSALVCKDHHPRCPEITASDCKAGGAWPGYCPKKCGICKCQDISLYCKDVKPWKCKESPDLYEICQESCGTCDTDTNTFPTVKPTKPTNPIESTKSTIVPSTCEDIFKRCSESRKRWFDTWLPMCAKMKLSPQMHIREWCKNHCRIVGTLMVDDVCKANKGIA